MGDTYPPTLAVSSSHRVLRISGESSDSILCTHAFAVARAVMMRMMRVEFHIGAAIKGVQSPEKALQ